MPADTCVMRFPGDQSETAEPGNDWWGCAWVTQPFIGKMNDESVPCVVDDIYSWREKMVVPDPYTMCDWEQVAKAGSAHWDRENQMGTIIVFEGHFERMHCLMGIEEALCAFYDEDAEDEIKGMFAAITEYKIKCLNIIKEYYNPDCVIYHDDWGTDRSMFFNPALWHKYIKPELKKIVDECHRLGMFFEMHSCGHIQEVIGALVEEVGIDSIQTLQYPQNDIRYIKKNWGGRLVIRGGYNDRVIMAKDATDEDIIAAVHDSIEVLAPGGNHIPYFYNMIGQGWEHAVSVFYSEVKKYEQEHGCC